MGPPNCALLVRQRPATRSQAADVGKIQFCYYAHTQEISSKLILVFGTHNERYVSTVDMTFPFDIALGVKARRGRFHINSIVGRAEWLRVWEPLRL